MSIECADEGHVVWQTIGAVGLAVICFGFPLVIYFLLKYLKDNDELDNPSTILKYGFFYIGFRDKRYNFEVVLMLRKVLFVFVPLLPFFHSESNENRHVASVAICMLMAVFFLMLHFMYPPYDKRSGGLHDHIETCMLMAVFSTLAAQAFITATDNTDAFTDDAGLSATQRKQLRNGTWFWIVMAFHTGVIVLVIWGVFRPCFHSLKIYKRFKKWYGATDFQYCSGGIISNNLASPQTELFATICGSLAATYLDNSPTFSFRSFALLLQQLCVDAGFWMALEDAYGQHGAGQMWVKHHTVLAYIPASETDQEAQRAEVISVLPDVVASLQVLAADVPLDLVCPGAGMFSAWLGQKSRPELDEYIAKVKDLLLAQICDFNLYRDRKVTVEEVYQSHLRCQGDVVLACRYFSHVYEQTRRHEDNTAAWQQAIKQGAITSHGFRQKRADKTLSSSGAMLKETSVHRHQRERRSLLDHVTHFQDITGYTVQHAKDTRAAAIDAEKQRKRKASADLEEYAEARQSKQNRAGIPPLSQGRVLSSHRRKMACQLAATQRQNKRISNDLCAFLSHLHQDEPEEHLPRTQGGHVNVFIVGAAHMGDADALTSKQRSLAKYKVLCSVVGRPLADVKAQFSTPVTKEISFPEWNHQGRLSGVAEGEDLKFEIHDMREFKKILSVVLPSSEFYSKGVFEGELLLVQSAGDGGIQKNTPRKIVSKQTLHVRISVEDPIFGALHNKPVLTDSSEQQASSVDVLANEPAPPQADIGDDLQFGLTSPSAPNADDDEMHFGNVQEAEDRAKLSSQIQIESIMELKRQIEEVRVELGRSNEEPSFANPLQLLTAALPRMLFGKAPDPGLLQVGRPIGGSAAGATKVTKEIEVQTEVDAKSDPNLSHQHEAEALRMKFKLKEVGEEIAAMQAQISDVHDELRDLQDAR